MILKQQEPYVYAVTRIHANEKHLLSSQDLEQLIAAKDLTTAIRYLSDKGWGSSDLLQNNQNNSDALISYETKRTWELVDELVGDDASFEVFRIANDYHNLKAAIKLCWLDENKLKDNKCFLKYGTVPIEKIISATIENNFSLLPEQVAIAGSAAHEALINTKSGQTVDIIIDKATLFAIDAAGKKSESVLLQHYARMTVDMANIKSAVRCLSMGKGSVFTEQVIAKCGSLNIEKLLKGACADEESIWACLKNTEYEEAIEKLKQSVSAFECWCGNKIIKLIKPQLKNYFTIEPIAAYILARENEFKLVRLILSAKQNSISVNTLRERLCDTYV